MMKFSFITILICLSLKLIHLNRYCNFGKLGKKHKNEENSYLEAEYDQNKHEWNSMRIYADFDGLKTSEESSKIIKSIIQEEIIPTAFRVLSKIFKVRRVKSIKLNRKLCEEHEIPENKYRDKAVEADLIIFIKFDETGEYEENKVEATAIKCYQDKLTKRPLVGLITYRKTLEHKTKTDKEYLIWLTIHEISHILLFDDSLYSDFIDENLKPLDFSKVIKKTKNKFNQEILFVQTENVLKKAKEHFNCDSITGIPLEFNGGDGNNGSHWSRKLLNTDYMIGRSHGENLISEISLAFFEDSGWYKPDYKMANIFYWGKNSGCKFLFGKCLEKSKIQKIQNIYMLSIKSKFREFCHKANEPICSLHNVFRGTCRIKLFDKNLPEKDRNFDNFKMGGLDNFVNRCPIIVENKFSQKYYGGSCRSGSSEMISKPEKICENCACFESTLREAKDDIYLDDHVLVNKDIISDKYNPYLKAACYEFSCDKGQINVIISNKKYPCESNKKISIPGYYGKIKCPDKNILCNEKYFCTFGCT